MVYLEVSPVKSGRIYSWREIKRYGGNVILQSVNLATPRRDQILSGGVAARCLCPNEIVH